MTRTIALPLLALLASSTLAAEETALVKQLDRIVQDRLDKAKIPASPLTDDAEFLRRVYLDLTGRIPTYEQTIAFLESKEADKRSRLIDELLARPEYGQHFATIWRDLIVDRTPEQSQVRQNYSWDFIDWLADGFNKSRGWNEIVSDMLTAEGEAKQNRASSFVLANRQNEFPRPEDLVGSTGRLFMGMQLRCAQCHDHPYVQGWKQDDFWGVAAFFGQLRDHTTDNNGGSRNPTLSEQPNPDAKKETGYLMRLKRQGLLGPQSGPQIGIPKVTDPTVAQKVLPAKFFLADAPKLDEKGPYRPKFAAWLTSAENPYFARAATNRLWAHFFTRGLVHPIDDIRPDKAASHPELLDLLVKEFKTSGFNHKHVIRLICNSQTYQRSSKPLPMNVEDRELYSHMAMKMLNADQTIDSLCIAIGRVPPTGKNRDQQTAPFVTKEADDDPTEFSHGIPQFLLQLNAGLANANPQVVNKLTLKKSKEEAITGLYLSALSRKPKAEEIKRMVNYLDKKPEINQGYRDLYWVLLNSAEFILNR